MVSLPLKGSLLLVLIGFPLLEPAGYEALTVSVTGRDASRVAHFTTLLSDRVEQPVRMVPPELAEVRVALGARAFRQALQADARVIGVDIPRELALAAYARGCTCSALFQGTDPRRQLRLLHLLLPGVQRVGVLVTPDSDWVRSRLAPAASGLSLVVLTLSGPAELAPALNRLLPRSGALLALESTGLYGPETARLVLLSSYRQRQPVIGPNRAFVRAGSLATTYASLVDRARSVAHWLQRLQAGKSLPAPGWSRYFSVTLNEPVARAYDLRLRPPEKLVAALKAGQP